MQPNDVVSKLQEMGVPAHWEHTYCEIPLGNGFALATGQHDWDMANLVNLATGDPVEDVRVCVQLPRSESQSAERVAVRWATAYHALKGGKS